MKASDCLKKKAQSLLVFLCLVGAWVGNATASDDPFGPLAIKDATRSAFEAGWSAAAVGDLAGLSASIEALSAEDPTSPLLPYLQFELHRQRVHELDEETITVFLAKHRDWSFAPTLETNWLKALGRAGRYGSIRRYLDQTGQAANDDEIRCYLVHDRVLQAAQLAPQAQSALVDDIQSLWLVGQSQHKACDPAFRWWRAQGQPTHEVAWARFLLTVKQNERSLAGYLKKYLDDNQRIWADRWLLMARYPHRALAEARRWPDGVYAQTLIEWGLIKLARQDWARARGHWLRLAPSFEFSDTATAAIMREIALFQAVSLDFGAIAAIDEVEAFGSDAQLLAWRARVAMVHGQWREVYSSIQAMPLNEQASAKWRYWRGRALAELERPDALIAYASISGEANYYGFLAAKKMGQSLSLCPETLMVDEALQAQLVLDPVLQRAMALYQVGLMSHARSTWFKWLSHLPTAKQHQAALLAAGLGWHDRAIATLANTGMMRAYHLRFPLGHRDDIERATSTHDVDPALVYGLMRAESAMQTDALSPVGAMGLLQLMPATARAVARRQGKALSSSAELHQPQKNIELGVAHLAELEEKFEGDWRLVAAAYNAGAGAVERWLARADVPDDVAPDVWIETLPFFETRDYVPRVLAFATIYEWQLARSPSVLAKHVAKNAPARPTTDQGFVCSAP